MGAEGTGRCHCEATFTGSEASWGLGVIPGEWKKADVTPIFKNGRRMIQGTGQPHFDPWEGYKATNLVNHLQ